MWPFEKARDVLRIGARGVELWRLEPLGLKQVRAVLLGGRTSLEASLRELLVPEASEKRPVDVVLESAWLPVVLLETGRQAWSRRVVEGLLRHRLARVHDERGDPVSDWALGVDHRPGDRFGLGFGLSPRVRAQVEQVCAGTGHVMASLQPALQWGLRRTRARSGWWVWLEQDRALVALLEQGRIVVLQPAAELPRNAAQLGRCLRVEQLRAGIEASPGGICLAGWEPPFAPPAASGLVWEGVAAPAQPASAGLTVERPA